MPTDGRYHVVVLPEGGTDTLKEWTEAGQVDLSHRGDGRNPEWSRLCEGMVRWSRSGKADTVEVFLCLLNDELIVRRDINYIRHLLTWAREHAWGAKLFLVASDDIHLNGELYEGREALQQWMEIALRERALDFLQISYADGSPTGEDKHRLRYAASRVLDRQKVLAVRHLIGGKWRCVLPPERIGLATFLFPLVQQYGARDEGTNLVILIDSADPLIQVHTVKKALRKYPDRSFLVATLGPQPSVKLKRFCIEDQRLETLYLNPIYLQGDFELWYLLLRLNDTSLPASLSMEPFDLTSAGEDYPIQAVVLEEEPSFLPVGVGKTPTVLVTSSFDPDKIGYCLDAARDVGWLIERAPLELRLLVDPAANRERILRRIEGESLDPAIWIHLGHGHESQSLWEIGSWDPIPPDKWLQSFRRRQFALPLALFLVCYSEDIARSFAQAGASVAIGFKKEVESNKCRILADQVLKAVLTRGWGRAAILEGFRQGCSDLMALEDASSSDPVAFFSI